MLGAVVHCFFCPALHGALESAAALLAVAVASAAAAACWLVAGGRAGR